MSTSSQCEPEKSPLRELQEPPQAASISTHVIDRADVAAKLDAKGSIDQGSRLAARLCIDDRSNSTLSSPSLSHRE